MLQYLETVDALLRGGREVTAKGQERLGPFETAEPARDLLGDYPALGARSSKWRKLIEVLEPAHVALKVDDDSVVSGRFTVPYALGSIR